MKCRHCARPLERVFADLATAPASNAFLTREQLAAPELFYPLRVLVCEGCWLVQTEDYAAREALFTEDYVYFSSYSASWLAHAEALATAAIERHALTGESLVVEVAANDGYLLQYFKARGIPCLGIEPTHSTATVARARGIEVLERFFGVALADELVAQGRRADLLLGLNVLAHVPDINDFLAGVARVLKPQGAACFEFPHLLELQRGSQFDTLYHEHYSYLSLAALARIAPANGLTLVDAEKLPTHGGSLRLTLRRVDATDVQPSARLLELMAEEQAAGIETPAFYAGFQTECERVRRELLAFLLAEHAAGRRVAAYGAAAKGNTLLNFAGVRSDLIAFVVDRNEHKQGRFLPGSRIPVLPVEAIYTDRPHTILILPWNLREEVAAQLAHTRAWGARMYVAVPEVEEVLA
jgi:SAM-dependent methyltransferase